MTEDFRHAVESHKNHVFTFACYYLGSRDQAEDVTQEVLIRLWRHFQDLRGSDLRPWLTTVTRNACFDQLRRERRNRSRFVVDERLEELEAADGQPDPERQAAASGLLQRLKAAIAELPDPLRSILILREIQQRPYREIGEELDMPINTVKVYAHRGRKRLREKLQSELPLAVR